MEERKREKRINRKGKERGLRERKYNLEAAAATHFLVIVPAWWAPSM